MAGSSVMTALMAVIAERKAAASGQTSYVKKLMDGGVAAIGAKIVEEAAEVVEAGDEPGDVGREHLVKEVADLVFHAAVMLGYRDPKSPGDRTHIQFQYWLPAVALSQGTAAPQLYLFEHKWGIPVPGPGGQGVATLAQAAASDAVTRSA